MTTIDRYVWIQPKPIKQTAAEITIAKDSVPLRFAVWLPLRMHLVSFLFLRNEMLSYSAKLSIWTL